MSLIVFFTEELSIKVMLESFLPRLYPNLEYLCIPFEGKQDLEKQLPIKLRGWKTPDTKFVVLRDQDRGDCYEIKDDLVRICSDNNRNNVLVRIVCRELESWYFGDLTAVEQGLELKDLKKYMNWKKYRNPDSILNPSKELIKITKKRYYKINGSREIGKYLSFDRNKSVSFGHFINGLKKLIS